MIASRANATAVSGIPSKNEPAIAPNKAAAAAISQRILIFGAPLRLGLKAYAFEHSFDLGSFLSLYILELPIWQSSVRR